MITMANRFRGLLPIVVDVETAGLNAQTDALLEIAAVFLAFDGEKLYPTKIYHEHVLPFPNARLDPKALALTNIQPDQPLRFALPESLALTAIFNPIHKEVKATECQRAILVGHNPTFDLAFIQAAIKRCKQKSPFHRFTTFDTATLSGLALGQTVLARACQKAGLGFNPNNAHSALYDAQKTAELFCWITNNFSDLDYL